MTVLLLLIDEVHSIWINVDVRLSSESFYDCTWNEMYLFYFYSGFIAERVNLRYFLSLGMLLSGFFTYLFGLAYTRKVHNLSYFILVQVNI